LEGDAADWITGEKRTIDGGCRPRRLADPTSPRRAREVSVERPGFLLVTFRGDIIRAQLTGDSSGLSRSSTRLLLTCSKSAGSRTVSQRPPSESRTPEKLGHCISTTPDEITPLERLRSTVGAVVSSRKVRSTARDGTAVLKLGRPEHEPAVARRRPKQADPGLTPRGLATPRPIAPTHGGVDVGPRLWDGESIQSRQPEATNVADQVTSLGRFSSIKFSASGRSNVPGRARRRSGEGMRPLGLVGAPWNTPDGFASARCEHLNQRRARRRIADQLLVHVDGRAVGRSVHGALDIAWPSEARLRP